MLMDAARYRLPFAVQDDGIPADSEGYVPGRCLYLFQIKERGGSEVTVERTLIRCGRSGRPSIKVRAPDC